MYVVRPAHAGCAVATIRIDLAAIRTSHLLAGVSLDLRHQRLAMVIEGVTRACGARPADARRAPSVASCARGTQAGF
jgi:hypothetical protein